MKVIGRSPAKVILFGEHFVVNGNTAISMAIDLPTQVIVEDLSNKSIHISSDNLGVTATFSRDGKTTQVLGPNAESILRPVFETASFTMRKFCSAGRGMKIRIASSVPVGMGLGSSAATAVATVAATAALQGKHLAKDDIFDAAYTLEKLVHGRPSGIDQATITHGGLIMYSNGKVDDKLNVPEPPRFIIGNTGKGRSTGELVAKVTKLRQESGATYASIASEAQEIAEKASRALRIGDQRAVGGLMNQNQRLLEMVGVSSPELEALILAARGAGALGAKLTGGGGGGCMIALVDQQASTRVARHIEEAGGQVIEGKFSADGVQSFIQEE